MVLSVFVARVMDRDRREDPVAIEALRGTRGARLDGGGMRCDGGDCGGIWWSSSSRRIDMESTGECMVESCCLGLSGRPGLCGVSGSRSCNLRAFGMSVVKNCVQQMSVATSSGTSCFSLITSLASC